MSDLKIFTDGGSRGNPGPSAIGILILDEKNNELFRLGKQIGVMTNNMAEYSAVLEALSWIKTNLKKNEGDYHVFMDSSLAVNQLNGVFKIKNQNLKKIIERIKNLEKEIPGKFCYSHVSREKNKIADFLVNSSF